MAISLVKELVKNSGGYIVPVLVSLPLLALVAQLPWAMDESDPDLIDDTTLILLTLLPFVIMVPIIPMLSRGNAMQIIKTANIEKRMEKLKKLGTKEFIKQTQAVLINESERGNKLYETVKIIKGRRLKFLVYQDKSTEREYISFVRDEYLDADEAMASKFRLGKKEYDMLKLENEA